MLPDDATVAEEFPRGSDLVRRCPDVRSLTFASTDARRRRGRCSTQASGYDHATGGRSPEAAGPSSGSELTAPRATRRDPQDAHKVVKSEGDAKVRLSDPGPPSTALRSQLSRSVGRRAPSSPAAPERGTAEICASTGIGHAAIYLRRGSAGTRWPSSKARKQ